MKVNVDASEMYIYEYKGIFVMLKFFYKSHHNYVVSEYKLFSK